MYTLFIVDPQEKRSSFLFTTTHWDITDNPVKWGSSMGLSLFKVPFKGSYIVITNLMWQSTKTKKPWDLFESSIWAALSSQICFCPGRSEGYSPYPPCFYTQLSSHRVMCRALPASTFERDRQAVARLMDLKHTYFVTLFYRKLSTDLNVKLQRHHPWKPKFAHILSL